MGKDMAHEVDYVHPRFVDYSFRKDKSDFLDVWLFSNCSLCVTTGSGPDMISDVFRRPILMLNFLPLQGAWSWSNTLIYPKILRIKDSGRLLSMQEYLDHSYSETSNYKDAGIEVNDLSDHEIVAAVKECIARNKFFSKTSFVDGSAQTRFREILMSHRSFFNHHGFIHPEFKLASTFLDYAGVSFLK
jgi:putative glycosyltransferase (TIGR04372 family)